MDIYVVTAIVFLGIYLFAGIYAGKQTKTVEDHYVMSRSAPAFLITGTLIASNLSSVTFIGYTGTAAQNGPFAMVASFGMTVVASLLIGLWIGKYFYRMRLLTIPDYFNKRYPGKHVQLLASLIVLVSMTIYMISVMLGAVVVTQNLLGFSPTISLIVILVIITLFTTIGGMRSVVVTDCIMFVVFLLGALVISPSIITHLGGMEAAVEKAKEAIPHIFVWTGKTPSFTAGMSILETNILSLINVMAAPHLMSRICIAKSEREFGKAMVYLSIAIPICIISLVYPFSFMSLIESASGEADVFPWVAKNLVPPVLGAIGLSGVIAAAISTATSLFQQASATLSSDIIKTYFKPDMTEDQLLKVSRISVVVIAIVVFIGSNNPQIGPASIMYAFLFATACFSSWLPSLIMGVLWRDATTQGAFWSMAISLPIIIILAVGRNMGIFPLWVVPNIIGLITSTIIMYVVSKFTETTPEQRELFDSIRR